MDAASDRPPLISPAPEGGGAAKHANNFNFLRLMLATAVIVSHSGEFIAGGTRDNDLLVRLFPDSGYTLGDMAVDAFFIISGFLITKSWASQPRPGAFLMKRILRIYPGFIIASILSEFVFGPLGGNPDYFATFSPWVFIRRVIVMSTPGEPEAFPELTSHAVNWAVWTIRWEFLCYVGVMVLGTLRMLRHRRVILALWAVCTAYHVVQSATGSHNLPGYHGPLSSLLGSLLRGYSMFLAGACYYLYADRIRYSRRGALLAFCVLVPFLFRHWATQLAFPACGGYLIFAAAFAPSRILQRFGGWADISYGTYLYGWPVQQTIVNQFRQIDQWGLTFSSIAASYLAGWLSWHLVEKHFLRLKPKPPAQAAIAAEAPLILAEAQLEGGAAAP